MERGSVLPCAQVMAKAGCPAFTCQDYLNSDKIDCGAWLAIDSD